MADLAQQFADILNAGDPDFAASLADALSSTIDSSGGENQSTKAEVNYSGTGGNDHASCGQCKNFEEPKNCKIVSGTISPDGVCDEYESGDSTGDSGGDSTSTNTSKDPSTPPSTKKDTTNEGTDTKSNSGDGSTGDGG